MTAATHQKLSLHSESEIHFVIPFEYKPCFLPTYFCLPCLSAFSLPPTFTIHGLIWHREKCKMNTNSLPPKNMPLEICMLFPTCSLSHIFCVIAVDLFSLHTCAHRERVNDKCCFFLVKQADTAWKIYAYMYICAIYIYIQIYIYMYIYLPQTSLNFFNFLMRLRVNHHI